MADSSANAGLKLESMKVVEGSYALAHAVMCCSPDVVSAYPITPQTHIVEHLSQFVADGLMPSEFITVDSEFSALSALVGSSVAGARCYSATTSQGLALMFEVLYNVSGMRLPVVMTVANRALSAPLSIWNDHQDSMGVRDSGWIQLYAESVQEAVDLTPIAYKIAEDEDILTPAMVCMDGFILTHVYEPVQLLDLETVNEFLPPYTPKIVLDPKNPKTFGAFVDPSMFTEYRYMQCQAQNKALSAIERADREFSEIFGRSYGGLLEVYGGDDAEVMLIAMGSVSGTIKDTIDELRSDGVKVGLTRIRSFRPFPVEAIRKAVADAHVIAVIEKDVTVGNDGALVSEIKAALYNSKVGIPVIGFAVGLGGRDVTVADVKRAVAKALAAKDGRMDHEFEFLSLREELL